MTAVRVVLVGAGAMGEIVARRVYATASPDRCRLVAVVDSRVERASAVGSALGVPAFATLSDVDGAEFDAVDLRLPHHVHAASALDALRAGHHVLVEKPLATTARDGAEIVRAAASSGCVVAVAENYPHLVAVRAARDAIACGEIGAVRNIRTTRAYTLDGVWLRDGWRTSGGPSAGILLDQGTHHTSLLRRLGGDIEAVSAWADATPGAAETVSVTVRFVSGCVGQSLYTWGTPAIDNDVEATVFGADGRIDVRVAYESGSGQALVWRDGVERPISAAENYYESHRRIVEDWVEAITTGRPPEVSAADAYADLLVVLAAAHSLREDGRPVPIAEFR